MSDITPKPSVIGRYVEFVQGAPPEKEGQWWLIYYTRYNGSMGAGEATLSGKNNGEWYVMRYGGVSDYVWPDQIVCYHKLMWSYLPKVFDKTPQV